MSRAHASSNQPHHCNRTRIITDSPSPIPQENVALAAYTTIGIGGPARYYTEAQSVDELREHLTWAAKRSLPVLMLGGGSNLLIADAGFDGLVIRTMLRGINEVIADDGRAEIKVAAGENWDAFVDHCVEVNLAGVECLSGIPGSVGASPIQNIGAYGQEVKDTISTVEVLDRKTLQARTFTNAEMQFSYRMSRLKAQDPDRYVVTSVTFVLQQGAQPTIRYGDLTKYIETQGIQQPTLHQVREAVLKVRAQKAMVIDPNEPNSRSCGSFFMNPIVTLQQFHQVNEIVTREGILGPGEKLPAYEAGLDHKKLPAAWLMERAGLKKGLRHGNVGLSEKHVLAIVNRGGGTSVEVLELVKIVQSAVDAKFKVRLEPEPVFVGFHV